MLIDGRHRVFKGLETDDEFEARIHEHYPWWPRGYHKTDALDFFAWESCRMQRRIVERAT